MAKILPFAQGRVKRCSVGQETPGEIVIFPGVRVEYHDVPPEPQTKRRARRARRDGSKDALSA